MAKTIVASQASEAQTDIVVSQDCWYCDIYTGPGASLIAAGIVKAEQLLPQEGRVFGRAAFFPDGKPVPRAVGGRLWSTPGYCVVINLGLERFKVSVTLGVGDQSARREAQRTPTVLDEDAEELKLVKEAALPLKHEFTSWCELWEGTKAQLQAAGIGAGLAFPGEPGAPKKKVATVDAAGFEIDIIPGDWKSAATNLHPGYRYMARSSYIAEPKEQLELLLPFAPGVLKRSSIYARSDTYVGCAKALAATGIIRPDQFPGQPGRGKMRCSFHADGTPANCGSGNARTRPGYFSVQCMGKGRYRMEIEVAEAERNRRAAASETLRVQRDLALDAARQDRMCARGVSESTSGTSAAPTNVEAFRSEKRKQLKLYLTFLWEGVFKASAGSFRYRFESDEDEYDDVVDAFKTLRDAVLSLAVVSNKKKAAEIDLRRRSGNAQRDASFQSFMRATKEAGAIDPDAAG